MKWQAMASSLHGSSIAHHCRGLTGSHSHFPLSPLLSQSIPASPDPGPTFSPPHSNHCSALLERLHIFSVSAFIIRRGIQPKFQAHFPFNVNQRESASETTFGHQNWFLIWQGSLNFQVSKSSPNPDLNIIVLEDCKMSSLCAINVERVSDNVETLYRSN